MQKLLINPEVDYFEIRNNNSESFKIFLLYQFQCFNKIPKDGRKALNNLSFFIVKILSIILLILVVIFSRFYGFI